MKVFRVIIAAVLLVLFSSCTAEVELIAKGNGTFDVKFKGSAGDAFVKMVQSAGGTEENFFDAAAIKDELEKSGFFDVLVNVNKTNLDISMSDKGQSFLESSGLVQQKAKKIDVIINRENLVSFYSKADEQIVAILDLLVAPVFNDEEMSEEEYLEVLGSFYGDSIAEEISRSMVKITLVDEDGKKSESSIPMTQIFCCNNEIALHSSN